MKMLRPLVLLVVLCCTGTASANVVYSYEGSLLTGGAPRVIIFDSGGVRDLLEFDGSERITGSFTVADPLIDFDGSVSPLSFSFSDGRDVLDDASLGLGIENFSVTTDGSGNIVYWEIALNDRGAASEPPDTFARISTNRPNPGPGPVSSPRLVSTFDRGAVSHCISAGCADTLTADASSLGVDTGVWTLSVASVPEPATAALLAAGLVGAGCARRRRA